MNLSLLRMKKIILLSVLTLFLLEGCVQKQTPQAGKTCSMNIATFNLRLDLESDGENAWPHRKEMVKDLIRFHEFDICGTQEGFAHMLKGIAELENYAYTGVGRDDGEEAGEHSAIVYRTDRFTLLDNGDFWLSQTPEEPSYGWEAEYKRICSWAKFKDNNCDKEFYFFSVHYDHIAKEARRESSKLMLERVKTIAGDHTFFVTGDFNATPDSEPMQIIYDAGWWYDSKGLSQLPPYGPEGTFQAFRIDAQPKERIDYIFVSEGVGVDKYGVLTDMRYGRFPSDHFPIMIRVNY